MARATLKRRLGRLEGQFGTDAGPEYVLAEVQDFEVPEPGVAFVPRARPAADCITFAAQTIERRAGETEAAFTARALAACRAAFPHLGVPVLKIRRARAVEAD